MSSTVPDPELKARHRKMWAAGDYAAMVETWISPLGERLVAAAGIEPGMHVLDIAAGSGNAALPAAQRGARVTASDLTPELLEAGRRRAEAAGLDLEWVAGDAESLPFDDAEFDVVLSCVGAMFAPRHQAAADEIVRVCRPGGTIALLSWTPEGHDRRDVRGVGPFAPPPPPGAQPPPLWGKRGPPSRELFGDRVDVPHAGARQIIEVTAFADAARPRRALPYAGTGPRSSPAPTPSVRGRGGRLDAAARTRCLRGVEPWQRRRARGTRKEYLLAVGTAMTFSARTVLAGALAAPLASAWCPGRPRSGSRSPRPGRRSGCRGPGARRGARPAGRAS
jgi:SAM-dependent methyltransferase